MPTSLKYRWKPAKFLEVYLKHWVLKDPQEVARRLHKEMTSELEFGQLELCNSTGINEGRVEKISGICKSSE